MGGFLIAVTVVSILSLCVKTIYEFVLVEAFVYLQGMKEAELQKRVAEKSDNS